MTSEPNFQGKIGKTYKESIPDWKEPPSTHDGNSPNVLIILLDDTGFANFGCFGSTIETPNIDALASNGLRYSNFHVTPLCSPTRASLLTGRNHHTVGMGSIGNYHDAGFPNLRGLVSRNAALLSEMLREEGYATYALGKWHLNPSEETSAAGPRHGWPLQRGFDRFYGFLAGATDQFYPELSYDNHPVDPPKTPEDGYHVTEDLVDHGIQFINDQKSIYPNTPFFMYLATGAMHYPHQVPEKYIEKYRGKFDEGWDVIRERYFNKQLELGIIPKNTKLPPRNPGVQPWNELGENEKKFMCRLQETWAGFLDHTDEQIGRLIDHLKSIGELDNTVVIITADNGTSQNGGPYGVMRVGPSSARNAANDGRTVGEEIGLPTIEENFSEIQSILDEIGGPKSYTDIPWGWSQVGNTPLRWYKQDTHGGGVRVPMIVHYPSSSDQGSTSGKIRNQFHHVSDITPTVLDILSIEPRSSYLGYDQIPISGTSFAYTLRKGNDDQSQKKVQYFEMSGNRAIWSEGWKAVTRHRKDDDYDSETWELYNLTEDFSETNNLSESEPVRLKKMIELWWSEAEKHGALPLDDRSFEKTGHSKQPGAYHEDLHYHYKAPLSHISSPLSPQILRGDWTLTADITIDNHETEGVIYSQGSSMDGFSLFIKENKLNLSHKSSGSETRLQSTESLDVGRVTIVLHSNDDSEGGLSISMHVDDKDFGVVSIDSKSKGSRMGSDVGKDALSPISDAYDSPFPFTGTIHTVDIVVVPR